MRGLSGGCADHHRQRQGAYYVHRTALPVTPQQIEAELAQLGLDVATSRKVYDLPDIQQSFVRVEDEHIREAALMLENIVCAAWPANALTLVRRRLQASNQIVDRLPIRPDTLRNAIAAVKKPSRVDVPLGAATTCKLMQNCSAL